MVTAAQTAATADSLYQEGRAILFNHGGYRYSGLMAANEKFEAACTADPSHAAANFFYAVTQMLVFVLEQNNGPDFGVIDTTGDLLGAFGAIRNSIDFVNEGEPFTDLPTFNDDYDPPVTIPGGETLQGFISGPFLTLLDSTISNLEAIGDPFNNTLFAYETGMEDVEIDYGDVLVYKSGLYTLKAHALILIAYDQNVPSADVRHMIALNNADLFQIQRDLLDRYDQFLKLREGGAALLTDAWQALDQGIGLFHDAFDYITAETDYQYDDLFYFEDNADINDARVVLTQLTELQDSVGENRTAAFTTTEEKWILTDENGKRLYLTVEKDPDGNIVDGRAGGMDGCVFLFCYGSVEAFDVDGSHVTIQLASNNWGCPVIATLQGTLSGSEIIEITNGEYEESSCFETRSGTFTGVRECSRSETERIDFNYLFGTNGKPPLDVREVIPAFDPSNEMKPGTFPPIDGSSPVLNGLTPDYPANDDLTKKLELEPSGGFTVPETTATIDGDPGDWPPQAVVFVDVAGDDGDPDKPGTDLEKLYLAKDAEYLYAGMSFYDGDPNTDAGTYYKFRLRNRYDTATPVLDITAYYTEGWRLRADKGPWGGWEQIGDYAENTAAGAGFLEWKVPISDIEGAIGSLSGKFVSALVETPPSGDPCAERDYRDYNDTMIQLGPLSELSGTVSFPDYTSGPLRVAAYDGPDPEVATLLGETVIAAPGPYAITGLAEGDNVYLFSFWDSDGNGIASFGDYWGMAGPALLAVGNNEINIDVVNEIDDSQILTKPGKYRIFGSNTYIIPPFMWQGNPNEIDWGDGWTFIGEGDADIPNTFDTAEYYKTILIIWHEDSNFYFDAFEDLTAGTAIATNADGTWSDFSWQFSGVANFDGYVYHWGPPNYFQGRPDGLYTRTDETENGFLVFTMPDDAIPPTAGRQLRLTAHGDADRDGLPDWVETNTRIYSGRTDTGSDPFNPDSDGDGTPDGWEVSFWLNPVYDDSGQDQDEDDVPNKEEYLAESRPDIPDSLWFNGGVLNHHEQDGSLSTRIGIGLGGNFPGVLPDDVESITVTGPSGELQYVLHDYNYFDQIHYFALNLEGSPELGTYTFKVKGGRHWQTGETMVGIKTDFQGINRTLPVPDPSRLSPQNEAIVTSKTPVFSWPGVEFPGVTLYYRLEILLDQEEYYRVYSSEYVEGKLSLAVPEGVLEPGKRYKWRVRVTDSDDHWEVQNRSCTDYLYFTTADAFTHGSPPAIYTDSYGAYTWQSSVETNLSLNVRVHDNDGVANDGSSHTVTVTYPDGETTRDLGFSSSSGGRSAHYKGGWGEPPVPGDYTFTVTDPEGNTGTYVDALVVAPLDPPDENSFAPSLKGETITSYWDNVFVNGALYETFDTYTTIDDLNPDKWEYVSCDNEADSISIDSQRLKFIKEGEVGSGQCRLKFTNGGSINAIQVDVTVAEASSDVPYSRLHGYFYNDGQRDVFAKVNVYADKVTWSVTYSINEGGMLSFNTFAGGELMTGISPGNTITISISWDGESLTFGADGETATFTPTGTVKPPENTSKWLITRIFLFTDTTPEFSWDPVPGANQYRVRIYNHDHSKTVWSGYTGSTAYTMPPGGLMPNARYEYRIYARDTHSPLEKDNMSWTPASSEDYYRFYTTMGEDPNPFIDLSSNGVRIWNGDTTEPYLSFWIKVHDAQGVPEKIASVTVTLPDGAEVPLYLDDAETGTRGIYRGHVYREDIQPGTYTFRVKDRDGNTHSKDEELTVDLIGYPSRESLRPVHGSVIGGTAVDFGWEDVAGAAFYQVEIYDADYNRIYNFAATQSEYHLAAGFLEEGRLYRYRIVTRREFYTQNVDNGSSSPWSKNDLLTFLTTSISSGVSDPRVDLDDRGVMVFQTLRPDTGAPAYGLSFRVRVIDEDGVPGNIASVSVAYPDGIERFLRYDEKENASTATYRGWERFDDPAGIPQGTYTFTVTDFDGNSGSAEDVLTVNLLPVPSILDPLRDSTVNRLDPILSWDDVAGAFAYRVGIYDGWSELIHSSGFLTQNRYRVPVGILAAGNTFSYRVEAFLEDPEIDADNFSLTNLFYSQMSHFSVVPDVPLPQPDAGAITGVKWEDLNGDGRRDDGEPGLPGWTIFLDNNGNGRLDDGEASTTTNENGFYAFDDLAPGDYTVVEVQQDGWEQTYPGGTGIWENQTLGSGEILSGVNFGNKDSYSGAPPRFTSPAPGEDDLNGMVGHGYTFTAKAQTGIGSCLGLTYSGSVHKDEVKQEDVLDIITITETECHVGDILFVPPAPGTFSIQIQVKDDVGILSGEPLSFDVEVMDELLMTPKSKAFLWESNLPPAERKHEFEIRGGTPFTGEDGRAYYKVEVLPKDREEPPVFKDEGDGRFKFTFDMKDRPDGVYFIIVTDRWGFEFISGLIRINTIVSIPQETETTTANDITTLEVTQADSKFFGATIEVPADAAPPEDLTLSMAKVETGFPFFSDNELKGAVIAPSAKDGNNDDIKFDKPVTITMPLGEILGPDDDPKQVVVIRYNEDTSQWEEVMCPSGNAQATCPLDEDKVECPLGVDDIGEPFITIRTCDFSLFAVVDPPTFQFEITGGTQIGNYHMITIPGTALEENIRDILEAFLGPYDPIVWRLFAFDPNTGKYVEVTDENKNLFGEDYRLKPGAAFWLIARNTTLLSVESLAYDATDGSAFYTVLSQGWNMFGYPWNDINDLSTNTHSIQVSFDGTNWKDFDKEENVLTSKFWKFKAMQGKEGDWYTEVDLSEEGLKPYHSYWLRNLKDVPVFLRMVKNGSIHDSTLDMPPVPDRLRKIAIAMLNHGMSTAAGDVIAASGAQPPAPPGGTGFANVPGAIGVYASSGGSGCFIATAAYGSPMASQVTVLRDFRDRMLMPSAGGRKFIEIYYAFSPPIAEFIANHGKLRRLVNLGLLPTVGAAWIILRIGPLSALGAALFLFSIAGVSAKRFIGKRRRR
jgi:hypothetical protein